MPQRVAVLADIHGNLPALEAALDAVRTSGVDVIVVAGDVLPGPMPSECLARLAALEPPVRCLLGNGDRESLAAVDGRELVTVPAAFQPPVRWGAAQLTATQIEWLRRWPAAFTLDVTGVGPVLVCHATPRSDTEIFTRLTPEASIAAAFEGVEAGVVVCGHTHMAFERTIGGRRVLNAGSVGMPFGAAGAHWLLLDEAGARFERTPYDLDAAAARIRQTSYPDADAFAAQYVLNPPSEETMLAAFERR